MEILFKNTTTYTKEELNKFLEFHKQQNMFKFIFLAILVIIMIIYIVIMNLIYHNWTSILFIVLFVLVMAMYYKNMNYKPKIKNNKKQKDKEFLFSFYKDYIEIKSTLEESNIKYSKVYKIFETEDRFYIYVNKEYAMLLDKYGFRLGTVKEFRKFIKKKCIFKYKRISD